MQNEINSKGISMNRILFLSLLCSLSVFAAQNIQITLKKLDSECTKGIYESCAKIANIYDDADLVKYDPHKALKYWDKACNGGIGDSCYSLGILYDEGTHGKNKVVIDEAKAVSAFKKGCDVGNQNCCDQLKMVHP